jgi:hypothetical protein
MDSKLPRRTFLMGWLGGLLAGWLGRAQAQAAPTPTPRPTVPPPSRAQRLWDSGIGETFTVIWAPPRHSEEGFHWQTVPASSAPFSYSSSALPSGPSIEPATGASNGTVSWTSQ